MASVAVAAGKKERAQRSTKATDKALLQERAQRRYAMEPIKLALKRSGRTQRWLMRELREQTALVVSYTSLCNYLSGYCRISRDILRAICWVVSNPHSFTPGSVITERDIMERVADVEVLIQQPTRQIRNKQRSRRQGQEYRQ